MFLVTSVAAAQGAKPVLWRDPGAIEKLDLGGSLDARVQPPKPPFTFLREDTSGTQPKVFIKDVNGATWDVKFGFEVKSEAFSWRIVRAAGYFLEPCFYVASGRFDRYRPILRKSSSLQSDGSFADARFQWRSPDYRFIRGKSWSWKSNPFRGTPELNGLKILLMLLSNYDNKDSLVGAAGGPNTGIFEQNVNGRKQLIYAFTDWGATMGRWGDKRGQTDWNCNDFTAQDGALVQGVKGGNVLFGYEGHMPGFNDRITTSDVGWLMQYLGRISDDQIRAALRASGATTTETDCFARALRARIEALRAVSRSSRTAATAH